MASNVFSYLYGLSAIVGTLLSASLVKQIPPKIKEYEDTWWYQMIALTLLVVSIEHDLIVSVVVAGLFLVVIRGSQYFYHLYQFRQRFE